MRRIRAELWLQDPTDLVSSEHVVAADMLDFLEHSLRVGGRGGREGQWEGRKGGRVGGGGVEEDVQVQGD